jgi:hypothetical protein
MTIADRFHSDPTRQLEEVQKVNARERAETDVREFYETDSAEGVLERLGEAIQTRPGEAARFLYIHATFGSGKTHLLKLVGLLADDESEFAYLGDRLAEQWPGFDELQRSITGLVNRSRAWYPVIPTVAYLGTAVVTVAESGRLLLLPAVLVQMLVLAVTYATFDAPYLPPPRCQSQFGAIPTLQNSQCSHSSRVSRWVASFCVSAS